MSQRSVPLSASTTPFEMSPGLADMLGAMSDPVLVQTVDRRWCYGNAALGHLLGQPAMVGTCLESDLFEAGTVAALTTAASQVWATGQSQTLTLTLPWAQGDRRPCQVRLIRWSSETDAPCVISIFQQIPATDQAQAESQRQSRRERLLGTIAQYLLQSLNPQQLLELSLQELQRFLQVDGVVFYGLRSPRTGSLVEVVNHPWPRWSQAATDGPSLRAAIADYCQGMPQAFADLTQVNLPAPLHHHWQTLGVQALMLIPVGEVSKPLGVLCVHHWRSPRPWQRWEIEALGDVANQISIAIDQAELYEQVRRLNAELEQQVNQRTRQLYQALEFEATLKRITDRVRDSLDETQILQTAVEELTGALGAKGSNTALYDLEQGTSTIYYEYNDSLPSYQGRVAQMEAFPEVYHQLLAGQYFQFCSREPNPMRGPVSMLACPILDDRGVLGDLWLINGSEYGFNDQEIRLVQQVSNQCAIAIRQARLYQAAQSQVKELERLNQLKDDFLSTVSHELRTPVTSMRVALQLLGVTLNQEFDLNSELQKPKTAQNRIARYYQVLKEECEREISLINDLLDLQRLDGGNHPIHAQRIDLTTWLPGIINSFQERAQSRQQQLQYTVATDVPPLISDSPSLERVFAELLNNACKYTPPGEKIHLAVTPLPGEHIQFQVSNSGVEIPPTELPRIFDKFYRVPSADPWKQGGTGLGLALVQKLLWHLGGEVQATSGDAQTCFTVTLPLRIA
jgi:signal transduction histidine kinase